MYLRDSNEHFVWNFFLFSTEHSNIKFPTYKCEIETIAI